MTADNKTLADVQPGGMVRLGDQAELDRHEFKAWARELLPCPFCGNGAEFVPYKDNGLTLKCKSMGCIQRNQRTLRYGIDWLRTSMTEHWNARALSAQPSPGGQGDALPPLPAEVDSVVCMIRGEKDMAEPLDYYYTADQMRAYAQAALAARQPAYVQGCDELHARTEGERAAYMEGLEEGKKIAARPQEVNDGA